MSIALAIAAMTIVLSGAETAPPPKEPLPPVQVQVVTGACRHFLLAGQEVSRQCQRKMAITRVPNRRMKFSFMLGDKDRQSVLSFDGDDSRKTPVADGRIRMPVDRMVIDLPGASRPKAAAASGECTFKPGADPGEIRCVETNADSTIEATFVSNGKGPPPREF